VTAIGLGL